MVQMISYRSIRPPEDMKSTAAHGYRWHCCIIPSAKASEEGLLEAFARKRWRDILKDCSNNYLFKTREDAFDCHEYFSGGVVPIRIFLKNVS